LIEIFNSDATIYNGSGVSNKEKITIEGMPYNGRDYSAELVLAPLAVSVFRIS
jgi:1,4-alpha-glucan branching enzyme